MKQKFGMMAGQELALYTLENSSGMEASITNYGGILTSLKVVDDSGNRGDVVLGFDNLEGYLATNLYFGCLVGRYANRIGQGSFILDGKTYKLAQNSDQNHIHGGNKGFDKVIWDARQVDTPLGQSLELTYVSRDGDEGYPGNLIVRVTYRLTEKNELEIDYFGVTDAETIVCLTHHSYFNLSKSPTILEHDLMLRADHYTEVDEDSIPTGRFCEVDETGLDFRTSRQIGAALESTPDLLLSGGFDHNFVLDQSAGQAQPVAILTAPDTRLQLEVFTTEPGLQLFTGNNLDGSVVGRNGINYPKYGGICLETQHFPDSPNRPEFPSVILHPGEVYRQTTSYRFSII